MWSDLQCEPYPSFAPRAFQRNLFRCGNFLLCFHFNPQLLKLKNPLIHQYIFRKLWPEVNGGASVEKSEKLMGFLVRQNATTGVANAARVQTPGTTTKTKRRIRRCASCRSATGACVAVAFLLWAIKNHLSCSGYRWYKLNHKIWAHLLMLKWTGNDI